MAAAGRGGAGRAGPAAALVLALALAAGIARAAAFSALPLISPRFAFGLPNATSNFSSSAPVTWDLLDRSNTERVVGMVPGYEIDWVTDTHLEVLAGSRGGIFHIRALRNSCTDATAAGCTDTATWVVLSDTQTAALAFTCFCLVSLCIVSCIRKLTPGAETPQEAALRQLNSSAVDSYYGSFAATSGAAGLPPGRGDVRLEMRSGPRTGIGPRRGGGGAGDTL